MFAEYLLDIVYLIASVLFIMGLKKLSHPESARRGNIMAAVGMGLAVAGTLILHKDDEGNPIGNSGWIFSGMIIGTVIGWIAAKKVKMTAMPEMVSMFNGMGGACVALIAIIEFPHFISNTTLFGVVLSGMIIGSVSFSGSMIAYMKLSGIMKKDIRIPYYNLLNTIFMLVILGLGVCLVMNNIDEENIGFWVKMLFLISLVYGVLFVFPIGGADMPVVISLLNSFTGMGAAFAGFMYNNMAMLTGGILVGSAGTILTVSMCKAMNRSLPGVIFGAFGGGAKDAGKGPHDKGVKELSTSDVAILLKYSRSVVIVPGYGLAVAQAQHIIHELEEMLIKSGVELKYAIHPVAGRMPGHMNVLLAEASVAYDKLFEMDDINPQFQNTDVVVVVGANDVVNPAANTDPSSPIYGMPILNVVNAKNVIVIKRSMGAGYAGIENSLFYHEKTSMLFGDAKKVITDLVSELKGM